MRRLYLDHAATTPLSPAARKAMLPLLGPSPANPSSMHREGRRARQAVDEARAALAEAAGALFGEVLFTSSGTESASLAILGAALGRRDDRRNRVLAGAADHHCVLETAPILERLGLRMELVPVDRRARMDLDAFEDMLGDDVLLGCLIHANNEVGTIQPVAEAAGLAGKAGALIFVDAVQTFPAARLDAWPEVDMISASAHKIHGPAGAGLLAVRSGTPIRPLIRGGGQEREMRAGTENIAAIAGFAAAAISMPHSSAASKAAARDAFLGRLEELIPGQFTVTARGADVLPGHAHLRLPGRKADSLLITLDAMGVAASSGAACSSGALEPSHVLLACGFTVDEAEEGLRFTFGRASAPEDGVRAAEALARIGRAQGSG